MCTTAAVSRRSRRSRAFGSLAGNRTLLRVLGLGLLAALLVAGLRVAPLTAEPDTAEPAAGIGDGLRLAVRQPRLRRSRSVPAWRASWPCWRWPGPATRCWWWPPAPCCSGRFRRI